VPELMSYTRRRRPEEPGPAAISRGNCGNRDWAMILVALGCEPGLFDDYEVWPAGRLPGISYRRHDPTLRRPSG